MRKQPQRARPTRGTSHLYIIVSGSEGGERTLRPPAGWTKIGQRAQTPQLKKTRLFWNDFHSQLDLRARQDQDAMSQRRARQRTTPLQCSIGHLASLGDQERMLSKTKVLPPATRTRMLSQMPIHSQRMVQSPQYLLMI